jgi:hypothetical protein
MQVKNALMIVVVALLGGAVGCSAQPAVEEAIEGPNTGTVNAHELTAAGPEIVTGTVVETMDAAGYTYVRVETDNGEIWAAANRFAVEVGDRVTFPLETPMRDFHSESLGRDFPLIHFVSFVSPEGEAPTGTAAATLDLPPGHPSLDAFAVDPENAAAVVDAPSGGMKIVDIWNNRVDLAGATVTVRGRVAKYNGAILGRNWLHIQDGSGELAKGTNDLTVTTATTVAVGDLVTAKGVVAVDRDFGAGYRYTVMLEDAIVTTQ